VGGEPSAPGNEKLPGPMAVRASLGPATSVDGDPVLVADPDAAGPRLESTGPGRAVLVDPVSGNRVAVLFGRIAAGPELGTTIREVVVDGWRFEVVLEPERRAALRTRARRGRGSVDSGGHHEVRAIIPGRIVAVSAAPGDAVVAGQPVLVLEAMKMQNEVRAPRDGRVERLLVGVGENVEVGDLLMVIT